MNAIEAQNVLIVGGGGREDALAWKLRQSPRVGDIYIAPGNGGSERFPGVHRVQMDIKNPMHVAQAAGDFDVGLVVVGPEDPLIAGVADELRKREIPTFGPGKAGAILEGSKADAVTFMSQHGVPHPRSEIFDDFDQAVSFISDENPWWDDGGLVVKADGPAAGKGAYVCDDREEAEAAFDQIMRAKIFGDSGNRVVIQQKVKGYEVSIMVIVSDGHYYLLPTSEDHKQIFDGDRGPNTGGMGVIAPHPLVPDYLAQEIETLIVRPTLVGLRRRGIQFRGLLYPGIMMTDDGPMVLEYNVRFGDPETEAVLPLLDTDLFPLLDTAAQGRMIFDGRVSTKSGSCVVVTLASAGYPGAYEKGKTIHGLAEAAKEKNVIIFHAGTKLQSDGTFVTAGGRVLMVAGVGEDAQSARAAAYGAGVSFDGMEKRSDIGNRKRG